MNLKVSDKAVDSVSYENLIPGKLEYSSKERNWDGFHFMRVNHPKHCSGSERPATTDHTLILAETGAVAGEYRFNSNKWRKFTWHTKTFFIGQAFENDRDVRWDAITPQEIDLSLCYMNLSPKLLKQVALETADKGPFSIELPHKLSFDDPLMFHLGVEIKKEIEGGNPFGSIFIETAIKLLSMHLLKYHCSVKYNIPEYKSYFASKKLNLVFEYIESNLDQDISLETLANLVHMSKYHFARLFKKVSGFPPHKYIIKKRIEKAKYLLSSTDLHVNLVAIEVGFTANNFFPVFKKIVGQTPNFYREQTKKTSTIIL